MKLDLHAFGSALARALVPRLGKAGGMLIGLFGGWLGLVTGFLLGHLVDLLAESWRNDRRILHYFEFPQAQSVGEPVPGAAAFCALSALVAQQSAATERERRGHLANDFSLVSSVARRCASFLGCAAEDAPLLEQYVRIATFNASRVNPDLLAESFAARRAGLGDGESMSENLSLFAQGAAGQALADRLCEMLAPGHQTVKRPEWLTTDLEEAWAILGLEPGTQEAEVKTAFRALAARFHPDSAHGLGREQARISAEAFIKIEKAYRLVMKSLNER